MWKSTMGWGTKVQAEEDVHVVMIYVKCRSSSEMQNIQPEI